MGLFDGIKAKRNMKKAQRDLAASVDALNAAMQAEEQARAEKQAKEEADEAKRKMEGQASA